MNQFKNHIHVFCAKKGHGAALIDFFDIHGSLASIRSAVVFWFSVGARFESHLGELNDAVHKLIQKYGKKTIASWLSILAVSWDEFETKVQSLYMDRKSTMASDAHMLLEVMKRSYMKPPRGYNMRLPSKAERMDKVDWPEGV